MRTETGTWKYILNPYRQRSCALFSSLISNVSRKPIQGLDKFMKAQLIGAFPKHRDVPWRRELHCFGKVKKKKKYRLVDSCKPIVLGDGILVGYSYLLPDKLPAHVYTPPCLVMWWATWYSLWRPNHSSQPSVEKAVKADAFVWVKLPKYIRRQVVGISTPRSNVNESHWGGLWFFSDSVKTLPISHFMLLEYMCKV